MSRKWRRPRRCDNSVSGVVETGARSVDFAVFTSSNCHSSGPNQTDELRRVFLAQSSSEPIKFE